MVRGKTTTTMYQPTEVVLAKVKGFPAWPAMIIPTELIPNNVLKGKQELEEETDDESKYIQYSSILKFRKFDKIKTQYCVKFFWDDSYIWLKPNDMKSLSIEDCNAWLKSGKKKSKKLVQAFEMASRGSEGIDVWEFVEYGSAGKPDQEYVVEDEIPEEEEEEEEEIPHSDVSEEYQEEKEEKPTRSSRRQKQKKDKENVRSTRSRSKTASKSEEPEELPAPEEEPKQKKRKYNRRTPEPRFHFEDDEDMYLVGLGPQDLDIQEEVSPIVHKLSNKRNLERHTEIKLDIMDRLLGANKLFLDILLSEKKPSKDSYQLILDELESALAAKGSHGEFLTIFQMNHELLLNFRVLFNLKANELQKLDLWDPFQSAFSSIYETEFEPDKLPWTTDSNTALSENNGIGSEV